MSVGTQVVAFDCPHGAREILQDGQVAPLIEYENVKMLSNAIENELIKDRTAIHDIELIESVKRFTAQISVEKYKSFIVS
jgi:glycosyltransferase involved in cell wall biosynthesis